MIYSFIHLFIYLFFYFNFQLDPVKISGHTAGIRNALFLNNNKWLVSASDDKTIRIWDRCSNQELIKLELNNTPSSIELSKDGTILTLCSGSMVSFWETNRIEKIKEFSIPTRVYSASIHPNKSVFICGGEDFKMYKYDFENGKELGIGRKKHDFQITNKTKHFFFYILFFRII